MGMKQSQAVLLYVKAIMGNTFQPGTPIKSYITDKQTDEVVDAVTQSIKDFETDFSEDARAKHNDDKKLRKYVSGMVDNWFRKGKELNGGVKYEAKNPGSRAGNSNPEIKASKQLVAKLIAEGRADDAAKVQEYIDAELAKLAEAKAPTVDAEKLPEHLRKYVG
jgi:hypothetical protein